MTIIYDQSALAGLLKVSKKTLQNIYSSAPNSLPQSIRIPGARGPRWTASAVQEWLDKRPAHVSMQPQVAQKQKKKAGRPRIAAGGAS